MENGNIKKTHTYNQKETERDVLRITWKESLENQTHTLFIEDKRDTRKQSIS